jgi:mono/diheme cytochrome c family protein
MRLFKTAVLSLPLALWSLGASAGGDAAAGKAIFDADCAECHYEDDFEGESEADILAALKGAKEEHKGDHLKKLDASQMANIATFWATAGQ